ncbi:hypothetical protein [uncultured Abyssibacter sp.]|uniref:hypothetical protein n=1 Tax=uncultured Abyssibacter sp. TaxID=2320202 RepID=UPI0032B2F1CF
MSIKHYLLTTEGEIREYDAERAARVAAGDSALPEFAGTDIHYVQVWVDDEPKGNELHVRTAGAIVHFDDAGHFEEASMPESSDDRMKFAHDTCIQLALHQEYQEPYTLH